MAVEVFDGGGLFGGVVRALCSGLVGSVPVVVVLVFGEDSAGMGFVDDQDVVEGFAADGSDHPFAVGVHPGYSWGAEQDVHVLGPEDGIEGLGVLGVAVAQDESQGLYAGAEIRGKVARLLGRPFSGGVAGDAGDVEATGAVFEERDGVEACAEHGVEVEEVGRDDALGLGGQELAPAWSGSAWGRLEAGGVQDLPDGGRRYRVSQSGEFTLDPSVAPLGFSFARRSTSFLSPAAVGGRPLRPRRAE